MIKGLIYSGHEFVITNVEFVSLGWLLLLKMLYLLISCVRTTCVRVRFFLLDSLSLRRHTVNNADLNDFLIRDTRQ